MFEYFARIWTADYGVDNSLKARLGYIVSFYGVVDLIAFLPLLFFPSASGSILIRLLRILRLIKIMKIDAVSRTVKRINSALLSSYNELIVSFSVSISIIFIGAIMMYYIEGPAQPEAFGSIPRALWWAVATLTTVGYGDVYPITALGKLIAAFLAIIGIAAVAMPAGILAAAFTNQNIDNDKT